MRGLHGNGLVMHESAMGEGVESTNEEEEEEEVVVAAAGKRYGDEGSDVAGELE